MNSFVKNQNKVARRNFLTGLGGVTLALPLLETFNPKAAQAQAAQEPFLLIVVNANGVVQAGTDIEGGADPERFWPSQVGALTQASLAADLESRTTGELSAHAERLLMVRGINHPFGDTRCAHASADAQALTSARPIGDSNKALANGESIDTVIARAKNPAGREPLVLHAGKYSPGGTGFDIPGYVSYISALQPRTYLDSPYNAYERMIGVIGTGTPTTEQDTARALLASRRASVNDLLRGQINDLLMRGDLSTGDRSRLDQHLTAIRDLEVAMQTASVLELSPETIQSMQDIDGSPYDMANHETLIQLHMELMALCASSDYSRVAVLKIGDREDDHEFTLDGTTFVYHTASHRAVANGAELCHQVDRVHARHFNSFLNRLQGIETINGPLIDQGLTIWTNQCANGAHHYQNIPWIISGTAGGFLQTGRFVETDSPTSAMLTTLLNAVGVEQEHFGDPELTPGLVSEVLA